MHLFSWQIKNRERYHIWSRWKSWLKSTEKQPRFCRAGLKTNCRKALQYSMWNRIHWMRVGSSEQQIWWNFKTRSWKNGQGVLEYSPTRNLCSGSPRRSWSSWTKNGLPMGRSIWKVDGRDSEDLQKKRYVAWKLVFMSMKNLKKNIHLISMRQIVDFLKYILLHEPISWSPIRGTR